MYVSTGPLPVRQGFQRDNDFVLNDLLRPSGFLVAAAGTLRLQEFGLLFAGVPCSSYIFISSSLHQRSPALPWGIENYQFVWEGNRLASRFLLLAAVAIVRLVKWGIENPKSTLIHVLPPMRFFMAKPFLGCQLVTWSRTKLGVDCIASKRHGPSDTKHPF